MKKVIGLAAALIIALSSLAAMTTYAVDEVDNAEVESAELVEQTVTEPSDTVPVGTEPSETEPDSTEPEETEPTEPEKPVVRKKQTIKCKKSFAKKFDAKSFSLKAKAKTKLTYKSGNKKIATVSKKGKVTVKGCGRTTITITAKKTKYYKSAKKKVTVTVKPSKLKFTGSRVYSSGYLNKLDVYFNPQKNCGGYEAKLSFESNFKNWLFFTAKKNSKGMTFNVGRNRTYYVAVRAYKKIDGKTYYGKWAVTSVRT